MSNLRNKLCVCGSGKKTKRCCGNEVERAARHQAAWAPPEPQPEMTTPREYRPMKSPLAALSLFSTAAILGSNR